MKASSHVAAAIGYALLTVFFASIWLATSKPNCSVLSCPLDLGFGSVWGSAISFLCAFLVGVEIVITYRLRSLGATFTESRKQKKLRMSGTWFIVIGFLLAGYGLFEANITIGCPASGCPTFYGGYWVLFYLGLFIIAIGALMVMISKFVKATATSVNAVSPISQKA